MYISRLSLQWNRLESQLEWDFVMPGVPVLRNRNICLAGNLKLMQCQVKYPILGCRSDVWSLCI
jgi:hypothetical protein